MKLYQRFLALCLLLAGTNLATGTVFGEAGHQRGLAEGLVTGDSEGYRRGNAGGYHRGYQDGVLAGQAAGQQAGLEEGRRAGYARGLCDGLSRQEPAVVVLHENLSIPIALVVVCNNTALELKDCELVLNARSETGGYRHRLERLRPGDTLVLGQSHFRSASGDRFPDGASVVEALLKAKLRDRAVEIEAVVFQS